MREDGSTGMAAGAISADAVGPSLDSTEFYWVGAARNDVQILQVDRKRVETEGESLFNLTTINYFYFCWFNCIHYLKKKTFCCF